MKKDLLELQPTIDTNIYASGDVLFETTEIPLFFRLTGGPGELKSIFAICLDDLAPVVDLYFFQTAVDVGTINTAFTIAEVDAPDLLYAHHIADTDWTDLGDFRIAQYSDIGHIVEPTGAGRSMFVAAKVTGTPTFTDGILFKLGIERE